MPDVRSLLASIEARRHSGRALDAFLARGKDRMLDLAFSAGLVQRHNRFAELARAHLGTVPRVFVETGTYRGDGTIRAARHFAKVHTIEISPLWHARSAARLAPYRNVTCHLGDTAEVLPPLLARIDEPAVIFLDAHFAGGTTGQGDVEVPLEAELAAVGRRPHADLVVIDDWHLAGKSGNLGEEGNPFYETMTFDWRGIDDDLVRHALGRSIARWEVDGTQLVLSGFGAARDAGNGARKGQGAASHAEPPRERPAST